MHKRQLRSVLRQSRRALSPQQQLKASQHLLRHIEHWPPFLSANRIALYRAADGEINPDGIFQLAQQRQIDCFLPRIIVDKKLLYPNRLKFAPYDQTSTFVVNKLGIDEPLVEPGLTMVATDIDLVFVPLVGFDLCGNRLGMGGGFYDATFSFKTTANQNQFPMLVGLAHDCQKVDHIDSQKWDIPLALVITDQGIYALGNTKLKTI